MKNPSILDYGESVVVVRLRDESIIAQGPDSDSPSCSESLDMVLGVLGDDSEFLVRYYDSRRFKAYEVE